MSKEMSIESSNILAALNTAIASMYRINMSNDILVLEQEYDNIIQNLNTSTIGDDESLVDLFLEIVDVISDKKRNNETRMGLSESKRTSGLAEPFLRVLEKILKKPLDPYTYLELGKESLLEYFKRRNDDAHTIQNLDKEDIEKYRQLQKKLFALSSKLTKNYGFEPKYMLRNKVLKRFWGTIDRPLLDRRASLVSFTLEQDLKLYAPYWFYRAQASNEAEYFNDAKDCLDKFIDVWRPVLIKDPYKLEAMKYKIGWLMNDTSKKEDDIKKEIQKCLSDMVSHIQVNDWKNNIFAGTIYSWLGDSETAIRYFDDVNADVDYMEITDTEKQNLHNYLDNYISKAKETERIKALPAKTGSDESTAPKVISSSIIHTHEPMSDDDFVELCKSGALAKVQEEIDNGANVNAKSNDDDGETALIWAVKRGHKEVAELLLLKGADVNAQSAHGSTALMWAARQGNEEIAELLLSKGADVEMRNNYDNTALIWAVKNGNAEVTSLLLQNGADINVKSYSDNRTPLIWAALNNHKQIAEILVKNKAEINAKDRFKKTALDWARYYPDFAQFLRNNGAENSPL